jgi:hypothetical protein
MHPSKSRVSEKHQQQQKRVRHTMQYCITDLLFCQSIPASKTGSVTFPPTVCLKLMSTQTVRTFLNHRQRTAHDDLIFRGPVNSRPFLCNIWCILFQFVKSANNSLVSLERPKTHQIPNTATNELRGLFCKHTFPGSAPTGLMMNPSFKRLPFARTTKIRLEIRNTSKGEA